MSDLQITVYKCVRLVLLMRIWNQAFLLVIAFAWKLTWDQALFSFRFVNNIPAGKAKRKESLIQTFYETSAAHFFDWLTFAESANRNYFRCMLFLKCKFFIRGKTAENSFYLLSTKDKTVSTVTFLKFLARIKKILKVISVGVEGKSFRKKGDRVYPKFKLLNRISSFLIELPFWIFIKRQFYPF